jgi:hypothetical protein
LTEFRHDHGDALHDERVGRTEGEAFEKTDEAMVRGALHDCDSGGVVFLAEVDSDVEHKSFPSARGCAAGCPLPKNRRR